MSQHVEAAGIICMVVIPIATTTHAMTRLGDLARGYAMADGLLPYPYLRMPGRLTAALALAGLGWVQDLESRGGVPDSWGWRR